MLPPAAMLMFRYAAADAAIIFADATTRLSQFMLTSL